MKHVFYLVVFLLVYVFSPFLVENAEALVCSTTRIINERASQCEDDLEGKTNPDTSPIRNCADSVLDCTPVNGTVPPGCKGGQACSSPPSCSTPVFNTCEETLGIKCDEVGCEWGYPECEDINGARCSNQSHFTVNSCRDIQGGNYGCWVLISCGQACLGNWECASNVCTSGVCGGASCGGSGGTSTPPAGGAGCNATCSDSAQCTGGLTCAAGNPRVCWGAGCGTGLPDPNCPSGLDVSNAADTTNPNITIHWNHGPGNGDRLVITDITGGGNTNVFTSGSNACVGGRDQNGNEVENDPYGSPNSGCLDWQECENPARVYQSGSNKQCYGKSDYTGESMVKTRPMVVPESLLIPGHLYRVSVFGGYPRWVDGSGWQADMSCTGISTTFALPDPPVKGYFDGFYTDAAGGGGGDGDHAQRQRQRVLFADAG